MTGTDGLEPDGQHPRQLREVTSAVGNADPVFRALADPTRRRLLDSLNGDDGQSLRSLCQEMHMSRQSVSKHLGILESAGLVTSVRVGRERLHYLNPVPINEIADRWIHQYDPGRVRTLSAQERALEGTMAGAPSFVYTTYIRSTPQELWRSLTDPDFTERWWMTTLRSRWTVGSSITWQTSDVIIEDPEQIVLESEPFRRLAYTWHTITPEIAQLHGFNDELLATISKEPRSRVLFRIEPIGEMVQLTVTHDGFEPEGTVVGMVSQGWPRLLSSLRSLLETGDALATASVEAREARRPASEE